MWDDKHTAWPEFGERIVGVEYVRRPGAYAVIHDAHRRIAILHIPQGYFLPGGGREADETPEQTLRREVLEECGYTISLHYKIGESVDRFFAQREQQYYEIHSHFFSATFQEPQSARGEADHQLLWLALEDALSLLSRPSQVWAIQQAR